MCIRDSFTSVFAFGAALAGLGGALQLPREAINLHMDLSMIAEAFVVVVVGGLGSVTGAYLAAVLIGVLHAFGILILPKITLVLVFLVMAAVLIVRPHGLLGKAASEPRGHAGQLFLLRPADGAAKLFGAVALSLLVLAPLVVPDHIVLTPVSYTHLDVYKRQAPHPQGQKGSIADLFLGGGIPY